MMMFVKKFMKSTEVFFLCMWYGLVSFLFSLFNDHRARNNNNCKARCAIYNAFLSHNVFFLNIQFCFIDLFISLSMVRSVKESDA